ncbi:putative ribonuclease H [Microsporum ferrugineum]
MNSICRVPLALRLSFRPSPRLSTPTSAISELTKALLTLSTGQAELDMSSVSENVVAGTKRKRNGEPKFYAVKIGFQPGIYNHWSECLAQVTGFKGAVLLTIRAAVVQSFPSREEADAFLTGNRAPSPQGGSTPTCTKFYGIQKGRVPGVYTDWAKAQDQVRGFRGPRYRKFSTREEAEAFVRNGQAPLDKDSLPGAPGMMEGNSKDDIGDEYAAGTGPLPLGADDGFDPNILLDPMTGKIVYKTPEQKKVTKMQPKPSGPPGMLKIYTDGSALRNGTARARAGVGVYFGPDDESRNVSEPLAGSRQTNQRAELTAISRALDIAPKHRDVTIFTDSKYSIDCVTVWYINWQRNNWVTSAQKPVENKDLVQSILAKIEERKSLKVKTLFEWVKGHNKDAGNEAADRLAVNGANMDDVKVEELSESTEEVKSRSKNKSRSRRNND